MNTKVPVQRNPRELQQPIESAHTPNRAARRKVGQPLEAINHPGAQLRLDVVLSLAGISRSAFYRLIQAGVAPRPLRYGSRCSRWLASDVSKFLADRAAQGAQR